MRESIIRRRRHESGQTIIIAMIILGLLLVLGSVFLGLISRNIKNTATNQRRSASADLAEAGVRYAQSRLSTSLSKADWRPPLTNLAPTGTDTTKDPDVLYLRPGTGRPLRSDSDTQLDKGGPDGLGPFYRVDFSNGRALVRVRYAPSDANIFSNDPAGPATQPGKQRNYTIIESIGREGALKFNDPTYVSSGKSVQFRNYATNQEFRDALALMKTQDQQVVNSSKSIAFASIGLIESARFFTNHDKTTRDAEIGFPEMVGVSYYDRFGTATANSVQVPLTLGTDLPLYNLGTPPIPTGASFPGGGSLYSNANVKVHGTVQTKLNAKMGEFWGIAGTIIGATNADELQIEYTDVNAAGVWQLPVTFTLSGPSLNSRSSSFDTGKGLIRDALAQPDAQGYPRGIAVKDPPLITAVDPDTGQSSYVQLTRESGALVNGGNSGRFGYGQGVYVNNGADRQMRLDESGREVVATNESLVYDWLNPNNGQSGSGWIGPFYVPRGAFLQLQYDGFTITRDGRAPADQLYWKGPDGNQPVDVNGNPVDSTVCRYRLGYGTDGELHAINSYTPDPANAGKAIDINAASPNFDAGPLFNGVLFFEGNVRVRGTIPTDVQLTVVSNASIYVEGSIVKGTLDASGARITVPSRSMLMAMARDFVVLNTTQLFGTSPQQLEEVNDVPSGVAWDPLRMRVADGSFEFINETILDPSLGPTNPSTWQPFATGYREFIDPNSDTGQAMASNLLLWHTMDDGPAAATFFTLDLNYGTGSSTYDFYTSDNNAATQPFIDSGTPAGSYIPAYGLGVEPWQRYAKFEGIGFPIVDSTATYNVGGSISMSGSSGSYTLFTDDTNYYLFRPTNVGPNPTNDYLVARAAMAPSDVRIEASLYAQDGSFFVIPGPPFNPNPNDSRQVFEDAIQNYITNDGLSEVDAVQQAQEDRLENFGAFPQIPFYDEPLDVRIQIFGSISENMPPPMSQQAQWLKRWGWIPRLMGGQYDFTGGTARPILIPKTHVPAGYDIRTTDPNNPMYVPNLTVTYDPVLATGRVNGFDNSVANPLVRYRAVDMDGNGAIDEWEKFPLPPMPRLPVSPSLSYFGEVKK